jgi:hypothetical protein
VETCFFYSNPFFIITHGGWWFVFVLFNGIVEAELGEGNTTCNVHLTMNPNKRFRAAVDAMTALTKPISADVAAAVANASQTSSGGVDTGSGGLGADLVSKALAINGARARVILGLTPIPDDGGGAAVAVGETAPCGSTASVDGGGDAESYARADSPTTKYATNKGSSPLISLVRSRSPVSLFTLSR